MNNDSNLETNTIMDPSAIPSSETLNNVDEDTSNQGKRKNQSCLYNSLTFF